MKRYKFLLVGPLYSHVVPNTGTNPTAHMSSDRPLPDNVKKDPRATGKRKAPHLKEPMGEPERIAYDSDDSEENATQVAGAFAESSSVNTETSDTSLPHRMAQNEARSVDEWE